MSVHFDIIKSKYDLKDLGDCAWILNMKLIRDYTKGTIILSQEAYIRQALIDRGIDINTFKIVLKYVKVSINFCIAKVYCFNITN